MTVHRNEMTIKVNKKKDVGKRFEGTWIGGDIINGTVLISEGEEP